MDAGTLRFPGQPIRQVLCRASRDHASLLQTLQSRSKVAKQLVLPQTTTSRPTAPIPGAETPITSGVEALPLHAVHGNATVLHGSTHAPQRELYPQGVSISSSSVEDDEPQDSDDDDPVLRPSRMPFEAMCLRLGAWRARFGTAHVPRRCFDAAELGAWVRYLRRRAARSRRCGRGGDGGALELWKVERLNILGFCWVVSREDAKWYANLHHLRHFKAMHLAGGGNGIGSGISGGVGGGTSSGIGTAAPAGSPSAAAVESASFDDGLHGGWKELAGWLRAQGALLSAGRLPLQKQLALSAVGVTLRVNQVEVERSVLLQVRVGSQAGWGGGVGGEAKGSVLLQVRLAGWAWVCWRAENWAKAL